MKNGLCFVILKIFFTTYVKCNYQIPEEETTFIILLTSAEPQAELDYSSTISNITVQTSDYVRGLLQFTEDTR